MKRWDNPEFVLSEIARAGHAKHFKNYAFISERLQNDRDFIIRILEKCPEMYEQLSDKFKDEEELLKLAITETNNMFRFASDRLKDDLDIAVYTIEKNPWSFIFVSERLTDNSYLAQKAVDGRVENIQYVSTRLRDDYDLAGSAVTKNGSLFKYLSERLKKNKTIAKLAIMNDISVIDYLPDELKYDLELLQIVLDSEQERDCLSSSSFNIEKLNNEVLQNREFMLKLIKRSPELYGKIDEKFKNDKAFILHAVRNRFFRERSLPEQFLNDPDIARILLQKDGNILEILNQTYRENIEYCALAVRSDKEALKFVDKKIRYEKPIIIELVKNGYVNVLNKIPAPLRKDREIVLLVAEYLKKNHRWADFEISFFPKEMQSDYEVALTVVINYPSELKFIDEKLRTDRNFIMEVLEKVDSTIEFANYISEEQKDDKELMMKIVKNNEDAFPQASARLRADYDFVLEVLKKNSMGRMFYKDIDKDLTNNRSFVLDAIKVNKYFFSYLADEFKDDEEIVRYCVSVNSDNFKDVSLRLRNNYHIAMLAVEGFFTNSKYIGDDLKNDREFLTELLIREGRGALNMTQSPLLSDLSFMKELITLNVKARDAVVFKDGVIPNFKAWLSEDDYQKITALIPERIEKSMSLFDIMFYHELHGAFEVKDYDGKLEDYSDEKALLILRLLQTKNYKQLVTLVKYAIEKQNNELLEIIFERELIDNNDIMTYTDLVRSTNNAYLISMFLSYTSGDKSLKDVVKEVRSNLVKRLEKAKALTKIEEENVYKYFLDDLEVMRLAIKLIPHEFSKCSERIRFNKEVVAVAYKAGSYDAISCTSDEIKDDELFIKELFVDSGRGYYYISDRLKHNIELAELAVKDSRDRIRQVPVELSTHPRIIRAAVSNYPAKYSSSYKLMNESYEIKNNLLICLLVVKKDPANYEGLLKKFKDDPVFKLASQKSTAYDDWEKLAHETQRIFSFGATVQVGDQLIDCNSDGVVDVGDEVIIDDKNNSKGRVIKTQNVPYNHLEVTTKITTITSSVKSGYVGESNLVKQLEFNNQLIFKLLVDDLLIVNDSFLRCLLQAKLLWKKILDEYNNFSINDLPKNVAELITDYLKTQGGALVFPHYHVDVKRSNGTVDSYYSHYNVRVGDSVTLEGEFSQGVVLSYDLWTHLTIKKNHILSNKTLDEELAAHKVKPFRYGNNEGTLEVKQVVQNEETKLLEESKEDSKKENIEKLVFAATGKFNSFTRDSLKAFIEGNGHVLIDKISKNANYLINNDLESVSSKNKFAKENNIVIISEEELKKLIGK